MVTNGKPIVIIELAYSQELQANLRFSATLCGRKQAAHQPPKKVYWKESSSKIYAVVAQLVEQLHGESQNSCPRPGKPDSESRITVKDQKWLRPWRQSF